MICGLSGCPRTFRTFEVYRNHVYDHHTDSENILIHENEENVEESAPMDAEEPMDADDTQPLHGNEIPRMKSAAIWILKVQETLGLTQSTMSKIIKDVTGFFQDLLVDLFSDITSVLANAGIANNIPGLAELFNTRSKYANPFAGLGSPYSQLKFYKEAFNFVVSMSGFACSLFCCGFLGTSAYSFRL